VAIAAPQRDQLGAPIQSTPAPQAVANVQWVTTQLTTNQVHTQASAPAWASYIGRPGTQILSVAVNHAPDAAQPVVATGLTQNSNDPTGTDALIATFSTDGSSATVSTLGLGAGTKTEGHSVDVDANGTVYIAGVTNAGGARTAIVASVGKGLQNPNWIVKFSGTTSSVANGLKLDSAGTNLYLTGAVDGNLWATKLNKLNTAMPSADSGGVFHVAGEGNGIAPDSQGDSDVAYTRVVGSDHLPAVAQIPPDGTSPASYTFASVGTKAGLGMNGVIVDYADNFYVTGAVGDTTSPFALLLVAGFDVNLTPLFGVGWQITDNATNQRAADFIGRGIQMDRYDNLFMAAVQDGGGAGSMYLFETDLTGQNYLDYQGNAFGTNNDQNRALALDTTINVAYMAGFTNSPDFSFTYTSAVPTYGGDPYDGILVEELLF
jgi:hypothetical protein